MNWPIESASFLIFLSEQPPKKVSHAPSFHTKRRDFPISFLPATSIHPSISGHASDCIRGLCQGGQDGIDPERSEPQRLRPPLLKGDPGHFHQGIRIWELETWKIPPKKKTSPKPNKKVKRTGYVAKFWWWRHRSVLKIFIFLSLLCIVHQLRLRQGWTKTWLSEAVGCQPIRLECQSARHLLCHPDRKQQSTEKFSTEALWAGCQDGWILDAHLVIMHPLQTHGALDGIMSILPCPCLEWHFYRDLTMNGSAITLNMKVAFHDKAWISIPHPFLGYGHRKVLSTPKSHLIAGASRKPATVEIGSIPLFKNIHVKTSLACTVAYIPENCPLIE